MGGLGSNCPLHKLPAICLYEQRLMVLPPPDFFSLHLFGSVVFHYRSEANTETPAQLLIGAVPNPGGPKCSMLRAVP